MFSNILHIILSIVVFFSTTGFHLGHHYCQNEVAGTAIFGFSGACHKNTHQACRQNGHCTAQKEAGKSCCHNEAEYFQQDLPKQVQVSGWDSLKKPAFFAAAHPVFTQYLLYSEAHLPTYQNYKPPIVCHDFQSELQTYRL